MTLQIVLAGLGVRGTYWAEVIRRSPDCEIAAYVDPNPAAAARAEAQYGPRPSFATVEAALAALEVVDGLVLANPPIGREAQVKAAAARRVPMLIEKPLALSVQEAAHLVALAGDVPLMVGLNFRYLAVTQAAIRLLREGTVGAAHFARFTYERWRDGHRPNLNKYPLTMNQPMLWEQSIHHFDLMRFVYDAEPIKVECHTWNPPWSMYASDANVAALITLQTRDGRSLLVNYQGTWQANWAQPNFEWRTECRDGVIIQRDQFGSLGYARRDDPQLTMIDLPPHELWITETSGLLAAFVDAVAHGRPLECSGHDHVMSLAMVEACARASQTGQPVMIQDVLQTVI
ncbi:MAG: Gfo/Idh/MocA family oxidoreductase [Aggregatilineales bacterium]